MYGNDRLHRHDHQKHNDKKPAFLKRKIDLGQRIACQPVYNDSKHDQYRCIKQCVCHITKKARVGQNGNIIFEKTAI